MMRDRSYREQMWVRAVLSALALVIMGHMTINRSAHSQEFYTPTDKQITARSKKITELSLGMSRYEVLRKMGPPTWAVVKGDTGRWSLYPNQALVLYWHNGACNPVGAAFNDQDVLMGWDAGRALCYTDGSYPLVPADSQKCPRSDERLFCEAEPPAEEKKPPDAVQKRLR